MISSRTPWGALLHTRRHSVMTNRLICACPMHSGMPHICTPPHRTVPHRHAPHRAVPRMHAPPLNGPTNVRTTGARCGCDSATCREKRRVCPSNSSICRRRRCVQISTGGVGGSGGEWCYPHHGHTRRPCVRACAGRTPCRSDIFHVGMHAQSCVVGTVGGGKGGGGR